MYWHPIMFKDARFLLEMENNRKKMIEAHVLDNLISLALAPYSFHIN